MEPIGGNVRGIEVVMFHGKLFWMGGILLVIL